MINITFIHIFGLFWIVLSFWLIILGFYKILIGNTAHDIFT